MREVARRLLGKVADPIEPIPKPTREDHEAVWRITAHYLYHRLHSASHVDFDRLPPEHARRPADMGAEAASAMRAVLLEVGELETQQKRKRHRNRSGTETSRRLDLATPHLNLQP